MKILVVSSYLPYPLHSGGEVRLYNLLLRLAKKHTITLVCEIRPHQTEKDIEEVKKFCKEVIVIPRKKQWSVGNIMKSGTSAHSFLITGHTLPAMKEKIADLLAENSFDLIHVETSYVMQNIPETNIPIVLTEHNMEYQVYEKYAMNKPLPMKKLLQLDIEKIKGEEHQFWKRAAAVVVVSEQEKEIVKKVVDTVDVVPNGVDIEVFKQKSLEPVFTKKEKRLLYIGNYKWIQNREALSWTLKEIWPKIEAKTDASVKLWVVGRDLPDEFGKYKSERVILEGLSQKPATELFSEAFALLAPLKVAGGTQYKILESMAVGTPVITTKLGIAGLGTAKEAILLGETPDEIADQALKLLENKTEYTSLAKKSREAVVEHFSFDAIAEKLDKVYHEVIKN